MVSHCEFEVLLKIQLFTSCIWNSANTPVIASCAVHIRDVALNLRSKLVEKYFCHSNVGIASFKHYLGKIILVDNSISIVSYR